MALFFLPEWPRLLWATFILDRYGVTATEPEIRAVFCRFHHRMDSVGEGEARSKELRMADKRLCGKCGAELTEVGTERLWT